MVDLRVQPARCEHCKSLRSERQPLIKQVMPDGRVLRVCWECSTAFAEPYRPALKEGTR
jgi:hypothetical protein